MKELIEKVQQWANDRNIINGCPAIKQAYKTLEECGELIEAIASHNAFIETYSALPKDIEMAKHSIKDAIGDITVTLIIQCAMQELDFAECLSDAYNVIKDRKGKLINGKFVKEE